MANCKNELSDFSNAIFIDGTFYDPGWSCTLGPDGSTEDCCEKWTKKEEQLQDYAMDMSGTMLGIFPKTNAPDVGAGHRQTCGCRCKNGDMLPMGQLNPGCDRPMHEPYEEWTLN